MTPEELRIDIIKLAVQQASPDKLAELIQEVAEENDSLKELLSAALRALCLTRDYVGEGTLPAIEGWEWYDAGKKISLAIPDDAWAEQFALRTPSTEEPES